jgi:hypothetical protein
MHFIFPHGKFDPQFSSKPLKWVGENLLQLLKSYTVPIDIIVSPAIFIFVRRHAANSIYHSKFPVGFKFLERVIKPTVDADFHHGIHQLIVSAGSLLRNIPLDFPGYLALYRALHPSSDPFDTAKYIPQSYEGNFPTENKQYVFS